MKENQNIEWKQSWRDEYLKWVCGFANAQGGTLEIESWGHGIDLIRNTCAAYGSPEPKFDCDTAGFWVGFAFPLSAVIDSPKGLGDGLGDSPQSRPLQLVRAKPMISITEMSQHLKISTTAVEKTIKRLKTKGMLQRIGSAKSGHWEVSDC